MTSRTARTALVIGASRNPGLAIAADLHQRGWRVVATSRGAARGELADLAATAKGGIELESVDITDGEQIAALRARLDGRELDLLFVNAGIAHENVPLPDVSVESFTEVMITNALSPMRVVEALGDLVRPQPGLGPDRTRRTRRAVGRSRQRTGRGRRAETRRSRAWSALHRLPGQRAALVS